MWIVQVKLNFINSILDLRLVCAADVFRLLHYRIDIMAQSELKISREEKRPNRFKLKTN